MSGHFPSASPKVRATLYLPQDLLEEARNAARDREEARLRAHADRMAELERTKRNS